MSEREQILTEDAPAAVGPYSQGIKVGGLLFISGQLPIDMKTGEFPETIGEQTKCCLQNLDAIAHEAGTTIQNAVKLTVFLTDMNDFAEVNTAYTEFFPGIPPARSCIAVSALPKNAEIEIEAIVAC
ncbi:MAG: RidA family protein [Oscillospiraceae bacterium]|nr:RidA family protein [Oscillospiraceae bacterium]